MRGEDGKSGSFFSYVDLEDRVPAKHPLRLIRGIVNDVLVSLSGRFEAHYSSTGRASIAPEKLLRALLLQAFYSVRSERQLMEQLEFNMLFRWFVGLGRDDSVWDATVFCKNRDRLLAAEISSRFLRGVVEHKKVRRLLSRDHFSVDRTLIEAWASMKSFRPKGDGGGPGGGGGPADAGEREGRNAERDFHGEKLSNATHESRTDADARLYRKGNGRESHLCYMGHAFMENRNGLAVGAPGDAPYRGPGPASGVRRKSTAARPAMPVMRSASVAASGSRKRRHAAVMCALATSAMAGTATSGTMPAISSDTSSASSGSCIASSCGASNSGSGSDGGDRADVGGYIG